MMSSRWPRPIGIRASSALRPVCSGSFTGWRSTTPGALNSSGRVSAALIASPPSSGMPSGSTTRPTSSGPTGISMMRPVRLTTSPSATFVHSPKSTHGDVRLLEVEGEARHPVGELEHLERHAVLEAVDARDAVADGDDRADLGDLDGPLVAGDLFLEDRRDLVRAELQRGYLGVLEEEEAGRRTVRSERRSSSSCARTDASTRRSRMRSTTPPRIAGSTTAVDGDALAGGLFEAACPARRPWRRRSRWPW